VSKTVCKSTEVKIRLTKNNITTRKTRVVEEQGSRPQHFVKIVTQAYVHMIRWTDLWTELLMTISSSLTYRWAAGDNYNINLKTCLLVLENIIALNNCVRNVPSNLLTYYLFSEFNKPTTTCCHTRQEHVDVEGFQVPSATSIKSCPSVTAHSDVNSCRPTDNDSSVINNHHHPLPCMVGMV